jgi:hypothetical protein
MKLTLEQFKKWGKEGGKRRAAKLTKAQRTAIARKAGKNRWKGKTK